MPYGSLHEYMTHECAKSSLAFRKPAGSLCEYMAHFRYKWLNCYVRMTLNVTLYTDMSVSNSVFRGGRTQL